MRSTAVRAYLQIAPRWVWSLINGLLFAGMMTLFGWIDYPASEHPFGKVVVGLVVGVPFGAFTGPIAVRQQRGLAAVAGDLSNDHLVVARRAARRGPVPLDSELRLAAARLADFQLVAMTRHRGLRIVVGSGLLGRYVWFAASSPRWWIVVVPLIGLFAATSGCPATCGGAWLSSPPTSAPADPYGSANTLLFCELPDFAEAGNFAERGWGRMTGCRLLGRTFRSGSFPSSRVSCPRG